LYVSTLHLIAHSFSPTALKNQIPILAKIVGRFLRKIEAVAGLYFPVCLFLLSYIVVISMTLDTETTMEFDSEFVRLTFDFISESAWGIEFNAVEDFEGEHAKFLKGNDSPLLAWV
jgi:hypothetical protein